jgi:hypothetical protein
VSREKLRGFARVAPLVRKKNYFRTTHQKELFSHRHEENWTSGVSGHELTSHDSRLTTHDPTTYLRYVDGGACVAQLACGGVGGVSGYGF